MIRRSLVLYAVAAMTLPTSGIASELVYRPVNPSFGGNPLNGSYLLGTAQAQNDFKDKSSGSSFRPTTGQDFADRITSALLGRVALEIGNQILGEDARPEGQFQLDGTLIDFRRDGDQVIVNIRDDATGGSTVIRIPAPVF